MLCVAFYFVAANRYQLMAFSFLIKTFWFTCCGFMHPCHWPQILHLQREQTTVPGVKLKAFEPDWTSHFMVDVISAPHIRVINHILWFISKSSVELRLSGESWRKTPTFILVDAAAQHSLFVQNRHVQDNISGGKIKPLVYSQNEKHKTLRRHSLSHFSTTAGATTGQSSSSALGLVQLEAITSYHTIWYLQYCETLLALQLRR